MKKYLIGFFVVIGALFVAWRVYVAYKQRQLVALFPRQDDREAAVVSALKDDSSLVALRKVLPPSAQNVRTNAGMIDLNPIGGNGNTLNLAVDYNFSPLNNGMLPSSLQLPRY